MVATSRRLRLALASAWLAAISLAHSAGTLDPTFVNGPTPVAGPRYISLAISPEGRIAIAGTIYAGQLGEIKLGWAAMFDDRGQLQTPFGGAGVAPLLLNAAQSNHSADALAFDPLGRVVVSGARLCCGGFTTRLRTDGKASTTYAIGAPGPVPPSNLGSALSLAIDRKSRVVVGGGTTFAGGGTTAGASPSPQALIARLAPDGSDDPTFGIGGQVMLASPGVVGALTMDDRDGIVFAFGANPLLNVSSASETKILMRLDENGIFDTQFGDGGQTVIPAGVAAVGDAHGRMLVIARQLGSVEGNYLLRFVDGRLDPTFGVAGAVALPRAYNTLTAAADGVVFVGTAEIASLGGFPPQQRNTLRVLRIRADGSIDTTYGTAGEVLASFDIEQPGGVSYPSLAVDAQGRLVVAASRFDGAGYFVPTRLFSVTVIMYRFTADAPSTPATAAAVEYHHATFDHYFITADADEIAKLDADASSGWQRTGESFTAQVRAEGSAMPVCRFFSGATFAPQSSHFYTPYSDECEAVEAGRAWDFEKIAFLMTLPVGGGQGNGNCMVGTVPLYRAFNAMKGGAPNHRYTTRASTLDAMIAQGWIMEGEANTRVFACVPS